MSIKANGGAKKKAATVKKTAKFDATSEQMSEEQPTEATSAEKVKKGIKPPTNFKLGKRDFENWNEVKDTNKSAFAITYEDNIKKEDFTGQIENTVKEIE